MLWYVVICEKWGDVFFVFWGNGGQEQVSSDQLWDRESNQLRDIGTVVQLPKFATIFNQTCHLRPMPASNTPMRWTVTVYTCSLWYINFDACSCPLQLSAQLPLKQKSSGLSYSKEPSSTPSCAGQRRMSYLGWTVGCFSLDVGQIKTLSGWLQQGRALYVAIFNTDNSVVRNKDTKCCERSLPTQVMNISSNIDANLLILRIRTTSNPEGHSAWIESIQKHLIDPINSRNLGI